MAEISFPKAYSSVDNVIRYVLQSSQATKSIIIQFIYFFD